MRSNPDTTELSLIKPGITRLGIGLSLLIALLYTLFYNALLSNAEDIPFLAALTGTILSTFVKLVLLFGSWYLIVRELHSLNSWAKAGLHFLGATVYSVVWYYGYLYLFDMFFGIEFLQGGGFIEDRIWVILSAFFEYVIVFSIIHVIVSIQKLKEREQQAAELRELSNRQQIANLKAQLNPHFLFNTLNIINAMVSKDVDQTRNMIAGLSDMLRYSIGSFEKEWVALSEEMEFVEQYLELEKHRYGDRLQYNILMDEELTNVEIPPMIIQPIVENAVKHGIGPTEKGGTIKITLTHNRNYMTVAVTDTGRGLTDPEEVKSSNGIGVRNTDEHLEKRYGEDSKLQFESVVPDGTKVWFRIPLGGDNQ